MPERWIDVGGNPLRLMMVHAHPDDETTTTGASAARYAAQGIPVHLVTCTRGERGEILDHQTLARVAGGDPDARAEELGRHRAGELAEAARHLGLRSWRFLGHPGRWWDSGMAGLPTVRHPKALAAGALREQAEELARVIREVRPQVIITYDERGGYGHPDHVRAHQVTMSAVGIAADQALAPGAGPAWTVAKVYACVIPYSVLRHSAEMLAGAVMEGPNPFARPPGPADGSAIWEDDPAGLPFGVPDEVVTARIDARPWLPAKVAAMRAHRSQMHQDGWFFVLANGGGGVFGIEHYRLLSGARVPCDGDALEHDLFSGIRQPEVAFMA